MKKLNNKGSTIVTSIIIVMVLLIIMGTALGIAYNYQNRAVQEHARKQAYLNAIGICDAIAGELNTGKESEFLPTGTIKYFKIPKLDITMIDEQLENKRTTSSTGTVTGEIRYEENDKTAVYIKVTSTYATQTETIELKLRVHEGKWKKVKYTDGSGNEVNPSET